MGGEMTLWVALGDFHSGGKYPRAVTDESRGRDSWMRDDSTTSVLEITFNPGTGGASVTVEKNTERSPSND